MIVDTLVHGHLTYLSVKPYLCIRHLMSPLLGIFTCHARLPPDLLCPPLATRHTSSVSIVLSCLSLDREASTTRHPPSHNRNTRRSLLSIFQHRHSIHYLYLPPSTTRPPWRPAAAPPNQPTTPPNPTAQCQPATWKQSAPTAKCPSAANSTSYPSDVKAAKGKARFRPIFSTQRPNPTNTLPPANSASTTAPKPPTNVPKPANGRRSARPQTADLKAIPLYPQNQTSSPTSSNARIRIARR